MGVVAFKVAQERRPTLTDVFCVQAYWRDRDKLAKGRWQEFFNMEAALRAGLMAAKRSEAVHIYRIRGSVEADYWEEPITVARLGPAREELPRLR